MSKTKKIWLITAAFLVAAGLFISVGAMIAFDIDFDQLNTMKYETNVYDLSGEFDKISIDTTTADIVFIPSDNENCKVICYEQERTKHTAEIENKTLIIEMVDNRKWYDHVGVFFGGGMKITVYLPQDKYSSLMIDTHTGDIEVPKSFTFENIRIKGSTGNVDCFANVSDTLDVRTHTGNINADTISAGTINLSATTGNINLDSVTSSGDFYVETSTGNIKLTDVNCSSLSAESSTGNITLRSVIAADRFTIRSSTGNVKFKNSDAASIYVKTSTGNVTGTLISEKIFITDTSTGDINVPKTITGGRCEITTSTGDIEISIQ